MSLTASLYSHDNKGLQNFKQAYCNFASWFKYNNLYQTKIKEDKHAKSEVDLSPFILL